MRKELLISAFTLCIALTANAQAGAASDSAGLSDVGKIVFGLDVSEEELSKMRDTKAIPKECAQRLDKLTDGVKVTNRKEFQLWAKSNKAALTKICKQKKLTKKQCMRMLVRYFTA